jgi:hypothetical protein
MMCEGLRNCVQYENVCKGIKEKECRCVCSGLLAIEILIQAPDALGKKSV